MDKKLRLVVEGWRFLPHSYAIVNQFQCLELRRRRDVELRHLDRPFSNRGWRQVRGMYEERVEAELAAIPLPGEGERVDAVLRMDFPHRLEPAKSGRTFVFMTCEFGILPGYHWRGGRKLGEWLAESDVMLITPSEWSRQGLIASGAEGARVKVVSHGVDTGIFHPLMEAERATRREDFGAGFYFFHTGAMSSNKNVPMLLKAFGQVLRRHPEVWLVLKGVDTLYQSDTRLQEHASLLEDGERVLTRIRYVGETMSFAEMAKLYGCMDAYVAPYGAEAFNLPVLEAAACGLPVICTAGGPTDEFTSAEFALPVAAAERAANLIDGTIGRCLEPSVESLVEQMMKVVEKREIRERAREAGPRFVKNGWLWSQVVERLVSVMVKP